MQLKTSFVRMSNDKHKQDNKHSLLPAHKQQPNKNEIERLHFCSKYTDAGTTLIIIIIFKDNLITDLYRYIA